MLGVPKSIVNFSLNHAKKVMSATAKITPGMAYPEIEIVLKKFKNLLLVTLFP